MVATKALDLSQKVVKTAFQKGDEEEDIYMEHFEGFIDTSYSDHVCELKRVLYGLEQAPRQWISKINDFFIKQLGIPICENDPCFFVYRGK